MAISMGFGDFYSDPNVEVNSPGRFAHGPINDALLSTWALAERFNNALGEISQQINNFFGQFWDIAQVAIIGRKI
jgi:hypothetical protein